MATPFRARLFYRLWVGVRFNADKYSRARRMWLRRVRSFS